MRLTPFEKARQALEKERFRRDPHWAIFESGLVTKDEHDHSNAIKPFPDVLYLRAMLDALLVSGRVLSPAGARYARDAGHSELWLQALASSGLLFVEKSRQVLVTWMVCAYLLWRAKSKEHQLILVQSKREDDAAGLVYVREPWQARLSFMESHLPPHLQTAKFPRCASYGRLTFPSGSTVIGIPEGQDIIRSNTASIVFSDEAAFQPQFGGAFTAALPSVKGGGQMVAVSSAEPGEFCDLVEAM